MARVFLENIKKIYDNGFVAVKEVNLDIADKEFMVIVGPSGCGKTTTLRMIAGLEEISDGTITIGDRVVNDVPPKDRDIAMVFQNYALYPHMTVFQNLAFSLKLRKFSKDEIKKRVTEVAEMLDISSQLDKKPKALSGGQRQRVALGRAIVRNPAAFLFDEPLSNLDAKLRVTTRAELKSLHRRLNTTSIYVTHDQAEAMTLGDRICVMYNGEIQQVAPPMEVYDKPINRFVAGFLGTPPMNFLKGKITAKDGKIIFLLHDSDVIEIKNANGQFKSYVGKEMVLGVRPEHLTVEPLVGQANNGIKSKVNLIEPLGDRKDVYLASTSGQKFIANLDPHTSIDVDHQVTMYIDVNKAHVFEPGETGKNIGAS
ncbi:MAG: sn-glycerol-3-phosphate ABC transporter ATP-binding protein UgpC [Phycisphaerales bacterium]